MQLFRADTTMILRDLKKQIAYENMKKLASKTAHNWPKLFSVLPTGPKSAQISYSVS